VNEDEGNEFEFWPNQLIALNADIGFIKEIYNGYLEKGSMDFRNPDEHTENFLFQVQGIVNLGMTNFDGFAVQLIIDNEDTLHVGTGDNKNDDFQQDIRGYKDEDEFGVIEVKLPIKCYITRINNKMEILGNTWDKIRTFHGSVDSCILLGFSDEYIVIRTKKEDTQKLIDNNMLFGESLIDEHTYTIKKVSYTIASEEEYVETCSEQNRNICCSQSGCTECWGYGWPRWNEKLCVVCKKPKSTMDNQDQWNSGDLCDCSYRSRLGLRL
jgi:hypothetical protein